MADLSFPEFADSSSWDEMPIPQAEFLLNTIVALFASGCAFCSMTIIGIDLYKLQVAGKEIFTSYAGARALAFVFMLALVAKSEKFRLHKVKLVPVADPAKTDHSPELITFMNLCVLVGLAVGGILTLVGWVTLRLVPLALGASWLVIGLWGIGRRLGLRRSLKHKVTTVNPIAVNSTLRPQHPDRTDNPYAAPESCNDVLPTPADPRIMFVVNLFTILSWGFAILLVPSGVVAICVILNQFISTGDSASTALIGIPVILCLLIGAPISAIRISRRMKMRDPTAIGPAKALCVLGAIIGFPIGTLVGLFFLKRINQHYNSYCTQ